MVDETERAAGRISCRLSAPQSNSNTSTNMSFRKPKATEDAATLELGDGTLMVLLIAREWNDGDGDGDGDAIRCGGMG